MLQARKFFTQVLPAFAAFTVCLGADCEKVEAPTPTFARFAGEQGTLVFANRGDDMNRVATVERTLSDGTSFYELHFEGGAGELTTRIPRIDQGFTVAGAFEGQLWSAVIGEDGQLRTQRVLSLDGYEHRVLDGVRRLGEFQTLVGTASQGSDRVALWASLRPDGELEWAFRSGAMPTQGFRVLSRLDSAGVLVGTSGGPGMQRPFVAEIDPSGSVLTSFELPAAAPAVVTDAEAQGEEEILIAAVIPLEPPNSGIVVSRLDPSTGQVRWHQRFTVNVGTVRSAQVVALQDFVLVAAEVDGFGAAPLLDSDVLYLWLGPQGTVAESYVYGSLAPDTPLELVSKNENAARALIRVEQSVETYEVTRPQVDGCGRRYPASVNILTLPNVATTLELSPEPHPLVAGTSVPTATRTFTDPLFICRR